MPLSLPPMLSSARGRKHAAGNLSLNARPLVAHIPGVVMVFAISIIILLGSSTPAEGTPLSFNNKYGPEMSFSSFPQQFDAKRVFVGRQLIPGFVCLLYTP
jgi:hypothetical protein